MSKIYLYLNRGKFSLASLGDEQKIIIHCLIPVNPCLHLRLKWLRGKMRKDTFFSGGGGEVHGRGEINVVPQGQASGQALQGQGLDNGKYFCLFKIIKMLD